MASWEQDAGRFCTYCGGTLTRRGCPNCDASQRASVTTERELTRQEVAERYRQRKVDAFDELCKSFNYVGSERSNPANYYHHPELLHEIEVQRAEKLHEQFWRWRPGIGTDEPPRSGMHVDGLRAVLQRVHGQKEGQHG